ncbi:glyceraldehyde 3-phosphate dehydrogenase (phosphorylating) [Nematocida homosporus]|uniref:glyceraldehyde 3-phosphate dehydrogenase (phosphorylating) n=1 Tax=Nematocida homosporus TaxID=1912981 RepID=UPI00221F9677|nr:glyceraldehyde 3-phosphate dehydrogenase (phosphorylating) [Nematocida homosporus]KAI5186343.1 glyceraldehyde 3-phosphate dehydrogenase (phosphorylating) [Nematocida homosporus]
MKIGINGAGRIGKLVARIALTRGFEIGCINDPFVDAKYLAYLLTRDSTHGPLRETQAKAEGNVLVLEGKYPARITILAERDPAKIGWQQYGVEYVIESSGVFKGITDCQGHLTSGAKAVIITAPSKDAPMFVVGVNEKEYQGQTVISNASCTTNCLAPLVKVLEESFGIEEGLMSTVHALTATQRIVDGMSMKQYRDGRGGLQNIIPASTGAAAAIGEVIPSLKGKLTGMSFRVPVADVSVVDLTVKLKRGASATEIKRKLKEASEGSLKGILAYTEEPVVSSDFIGETASSVFDAEASIFLSDTFIKLVAWYDNEYGYSSRVIDLLAHISKSQ